MSVDVTISISNPEEKVMKYFSREGETVADMVDRAALLYATKKADRIIREMTNLNPNKLTIAEKVTAINGLTLPEHGAHV